jgi:hypothetical protein
MCKFRTSQEEPPGKGTAGRKKGPGIDWLTPGLTASVGSFEIISSYDKSLDAPVYRHE